MRNLNMVTDPEIRMILDMPCKFENYDVVYDDEDMIKFYQHKAKLCGVKTVLNGDGQGTQSETCEGTVANCICYLRDFIEADYGYQAGMCMKILSAKPTPAFKGAFTKFVNWISASHRFEDFGQGVTDGLMMSAYYLR